MLLDDLLGLLRSYAPEETALPNDPVGLLIAPATPNIAAAVVCLDATPHVLDQAEALRCGLIIVHHPLIYHPLKRLDHTNPISAAAMRLVRSGIGLYAMHTNWDAAEGGINDVLAERLGLSSICKLGDQGEAALARIGSLPAPLSPRELLERTGSRLGHLPTSAIRYPRLLDGSAAIEAIAVCGGAGSSLVRAAVERGVQALVTADVRHHEFVDAASCGFLLIDAGHEATEAPGMQALAERLAGHEPKLQVHYVPNWPE